MLGLAAAMHQCGLRPLARSAQLPVYAQILADVGDEQSIARSLSTFSGHLRSIAAIVSVAGPGTLVLLDEVAAGHRSDRGRRTRPGTARGPAGAWRTDARDHALPRAQGVGGPPRRSRERVRGLRCRDARTDVHAHGRTAGRLARAADGRSPRARHARSSRLHAPAWRPSASSSRSCSPPPPRASAAPPRRVRTRTACAPRPARRPSSPRTGRSSCRARSRWCAHRHSRRASARSSEAERELAVERRELEELRAEIRAARASERARRASPRRPQRSAPSASATAGWVLRPSACAARRASSRRSRRCQAVGPAGRRRPGDLAGASACAA